MRGLEGPQGEQRHSSTLPLTSALYGVESHAPDALGPGNRSGCPPAGWAPGPIWTGAENLAPTGDQSSHRRARSQSLYRLTHSTM
jgi:hypothetical protein